MDEVLAQPNADEPHRNEVISLKKLLKGDGSWGTRKLLLGWIVDTVRQTLELPPHRKEILANIFADLARTKRVSERKWRKVLGSLRFVSQATPGSAGLFCALQLALNRSSDGRIRITKALRLHIDAFASLAASLCHRPTHLAEIVAQEPSRAGATDAAKPGMGGIFYDTDGNPYLWRYPFPQDMQDNIVAADNLSGLITNSDLEQAGVLGQLYIMCDESDLRYATVSTGTDNTPTVSRFSKGAVSSDGPAAQLCNLSCMHQRQHRYCHLITHLPGEDNVMADDASRLQHLTDAALLSHFEQRYPQGKPWRLLHLRPEHASKLISALRCELQNTPPLDELAAPTTRVEEAQFGQLPLTDGWSLFRLKIRTPNVTNPHRQDCPCSLHFKT